MTTVQAPENNPVSTPAEKVSIRQLMHTGKDWLHFFLRRLWIIALAGIIGGLLGIWIAYRDKPTYESRLTFALDDGGGDMSGVSSIAAQFGINLGRAGGKSFFSGDNIIEILRSRRIVKSVLLSIDTVNNKPIRMVQHFIDFNKTPDTDDSKTPVINFPESLDISKFSYRQDSMLQVIVDQFSDKLIQAQRPDRKLDIYELKVTTRNEHFSKVFTDRIIQATTQFYTELRMKKSRETVAILEQRMAEMKGSLGSSIAARASAQDANLNPAFANAQVPLQKQSVNVQVYGTAYGEMFKNLEIARFQLLKDMPLLQIIDAADYPMKKIKMGKLVTGIKYGLLFTFLSVLILAAIRYTKLNF